MRAAVRRGVAVSLAAAPVLLAPASVLAAEPFSYNPPGVLTPGSGDGRFDEHVYAPGMRFPIEQGPAFLNSQVWGHGGSHGPGGGQCDPENRQYPWWDNYCEKRSWDMPLCPGGQGHQGQDIRAGDCDKGKHRVVAAVDGTITQVGTYSVYLTAADGTRFDYLHMGNVEVAVGDEVKQGDALGLVSNEFGGTPTTVHLHFNIKQNVAGIGLVFVPPYMSLVRSYQEHVNTEARGVLERATCERVTGTSFDPDTPDLPSDVHVSIGGTWSDAAAVGVDVRADRATSTLCGEGVPSCARGFDTMLPIALLDGEPRDVHVYALDTWLEGAPAELAKSPAGVSCEAFSIEGRVRRLVGDHLSAEWGLSLFFDQLPMSPEEIEALPEGEPLPREPSLVAAEDGSARWVHDQEVLRPISDDAMFMFRLDPARARVWSREQLDLVTKGRPWPSRPALARGPSDAFYLLDDPEEEEIDTQEVGPDVGEGATCDTAFCSYGGASGGSGAGGAGLAAVSGLVSAWIRRRRHRSVTSDARVR
jgi:murein DD-endopeptidase MepM/ murein hydrolase activator NlpD